MKRCASCGESKAQESFSRDKARKDGRYAYCKACSHQKHMDWIRRNREKVNAQSTAWYWRNQQRALEVAAAWRDRNREKIRSYDRARAKALPDVYAAKALNRRALKLLAFVEHVDSLVVLRLGHGRCGICGDPIEGRFDVDHIVPLSRGGEHSYRNTQPAHPVCNYRKGARVA